jgi:hypothetical protein
MYLNKAITGLAAVLFMGALGAQAGITLGVEDFGQGLDFNGNGSSGGSFAINNPTTAETGLWQTVNGVPGTLNSSAQLAVTGSTSASQDSTGLSVWFSSGALWNYSKVQTTAGGGQTASASSSSPVDFYIGTVSGAVASGVVDWAKVTTSASGDSVTINIADFVYKGTGSSDLAALVAAEGNGTLDLTLTWASTELLSQIEGSQTTTPVSGEIVAPVPEPGTMVAGLAMVGVMVAAGFRRKRQ